MGEGTTLFSEWLSRHRQGAVDAEITAKLAELTERVAFLSKKGSITVKFSIVPSASKDADWLNVVDLVTVDLPEPDRATAIYWPDPATHTLVRNDPHQERMFPDAKKGE